MKKNTGRRIINEVLIALNEGEHIPNEIKDFIDTILTDYFYIGKLDYSIYSIIRYHTELVEISKVKEALKELEGEE